MFFSCFIRASVNKINIYLCVILFSTSEKYAIFFLKIFKIKMGWSVNHGVRLVMFLAQTSVFSFLLIYIYKKESEL